MTIYAIYGATGHTGRLVTSELLARGKDVVLSGRDPERLAALGQPRIHPASVDDPESLRALADSADIVVNCAGPFATTGLPLAAAAAAAGRHYVDHALEVHHVRRLFEEFGAPASRGGFTMLPDASFYGGLGDLLAGAVARGMSDIERVTVAYSVANWKMTTGAVATARLLFADTDRIGFADGALQFGFVEPRNAVFAFPPPVGPRTMIAPVPFPEPLTVPRHVRTRAVEAQLTARTFEEERAFTSESLPAEERADSEYTVAVQVLGAHGAAAGHVRGRDLWRVSALIAAEAAIRIAEGGVKSGVLSPGEAFDAVEFLTTLADRGVFTLELPTQS